MGNLKKISKGKLVLIRIVILAVGTLATFYFWVGYLPFIGNAIAEKKLTEYVHTQQENPQLIKPRFDWYDGKYVYVSNNGQSYSYRLQNNSIHDEEFNEQVNLEANSDYEEVVEQFPSNLEFPNGISVWTTVNADDYTIKAQRLYLLGIYNTEDLTEEESKRMAGRIAEDFCELMGAGYNFTGIQLNYADKNGMYEIAISADTFDALVDRELFQHTRKFSEDQLPLDYLEWLDRKRTDT